MRDIEFRTICRAHVSKLSLGYIEHRTISRVHSTKLPSGYIGCRTIDIIHASKLYLGYIELRTICRVYARKLSIAYISKTLIAPGRFHGLIVVWLLVKPVVLIIVWVIGFGGEWLFSLALVCYTEFSGFLGMTLTDVRIPALGGVKILV